MSDNHKWIRQDYQIKSKRCLLPSLVNTYDRVTTKIIRVWVWSIAHWTLVTESYRTSSRTTHYCNNFKWIRIIQTKLCHVYNFCCLCYHEVTGEYVGKSLNGKVSSCRASLIYFWRGVCQWFGLWCFQFLWLVRLPGNSVAEPNDIFPGCIKITSYLVSCLLGP